MSGRSELPAPGALVREYATRAKKRFGQHFLTDPAILQRVAAAAGVADGDRVLEIGPGCGTLTVELLRIGAEVRSIELDRDAAEFLRHALVSERFELVEGDANEVDLDLLCPAGPTPWKVAANLPYNVATQLLFRLLEVPRPFGTMALMFQKEVAQRIVAGPGDAAYGGLSLKARLYADISMAFKLGPGAFTPPPKVHSAVVKVEPLSVPRIAEPAKREAFVQLVNAGFSQRRKTLRNALSAFAGGKTPAEELLDAAGISPSSRAEVVDFDGFSALADVVVSRAR